MEKFISTLCVRIRKKYWIHVWNLEFESYSNISNVNVRIRIRICALAGGCLYKIFIPQICWFKYKRNNRINLSNSILHYELTVTLIGRLTIHCISAIFGVLLVFTKSKWAYLVDLYTALMTKCLSNNVEFGLYDNRIYMFIKYRIVTKYSLF